MADRIGPYNRLGPDLATTWGTYASPYVTAPQSAVDTRAQWQPPTVRGRHAYRVQPRPLGPLAMLKADPVKLVEGALYDTTRRRRDSSLVASSPAHAYAMGADDIDHQKETKYGMCIFLGGLGVAWLAYLATAGTPRRRTR